METETRAAATQLGLSQRQVQRMAQSGRVAHRTVAGRTVVAGRSLVAASRSSARGRHWDDLTVRAACDLLERGSTNAMSGSQRSRLRARVRAISLAELAYQVLGHRVTIWRNTQGGVRSTVQIADGLTSTGGSLAVTVTPKAAAYARQLRMLEDLEGDSIVIELETDATGVVEDIALYAYGDERTSSAAGQRIRARQIALS